LATVSCFYRLISSVVLSSWRSLDVPTDSPRQWFSECPCTIPFDQHVLTTLLKRTRLWLDDQNHQINRISPDNAHNSRQHNVTQSQPSTNQSTEVFLTKSTLVRTQQHNSPTSSTFKTRMPSNCPPYPQHIRASLSTNHRTPPTMMTSRPHMMFQRRVDAESRSCLLML
jgi:hypothetical protein